MSRTIGWVSVPSLRRTIIVTRRGELGVRAGQVKWNCRANNGMGAPGLRTPSWEREAPPVGGINQAQQMSWSRRRAGEEKAERGAEGR